jgi:hypothetical protein
MSGIPKAVVFSRPFAISIGTGQAIQLGLGSHIETTKPRRTKMSKMNTEKKLVRRKLSLNRETLRSLSDQTLERVAGGDQAEYSMLLCDILSRRCTSW